MTNHPANIGPPAPSILARLSDEDRELFLSARCRRVGDKVAIEFPLDAATIAAVVRITQALGAELTVTDKTPTSENGTTVHRLIEDARRRPRHRPPAQ